MPKLTAEERAKTSRENGAKGGRPRGRLPQKILEQIGPVPQKPADFDDWKFRALAALFMAQASGEVERDLAASLRATLGEMRRNAAASPARSTDDEEDDDEEDEGPELEEAAPDDGALRVEP
jgi:hypothetical protein